MSQGIFAFASNPPAIGFGSPVQFVVQNPDFAQLQAGMGALYQRAMQINGLNGIQIDLKVNKPELTVRFDRDRAEDLGVPVRDVTGLYLRGQSGSLVQLSAIASVDEGVGPQSLIHYNRVRSFTLSANLNPGFTLGEAIDSLNAAAAQVPPPGGHT